MGYWISNWVNAKGSQEDIDTFISDLTQRHPESLNDEGDIVWSEEQFSFYNILPPPEDMLISGEWWGQKGVEWRDIVWECYDPSALISAGNVTGNVVGATISFDTKNNWPSSKLFIELMTKYSNLSFNIWIEGEDMEAVEYNSDAGVINRIDHPSPSSHADYEARDLLDSCYCSCYDNPDDWFPDCPSLEQGLYKVQMTYTYYVKANTMNVAHHAVVHYENGFDMPDNTTLIKHDITPEILTVEVDEVPDSKLQQHASQ
jgi:hypothetical protein